MGCFSVVLAPSCSLREPTVTSLKHLLRKDCLAERRLRAPTVIWSEVTCSLRLKVERGPIGKTSSAHRHGFREIQARWWEASILATDLAASKLSGGGARSRSSGEAYLTRAGRLSAALRHPQRSVLTQTEICRRVAGCSRNRFHRQIRLAAVLLGACCFAVTSATSPPH